MLAIANNPSTACGFAAVGVIALLSRLFPHLLGESAAPEALDAIEAAVVDVPGVESVIHLRTMHLGPEEILVGLKVAVLPTATAAELAVTINALEARIRAVVPIACVIYIEPDIYVPRLPGGDSGV